MPLGKWCCDMVRSSRHLESRSIGRAIQDWPQDIYTPLPLRQISSVSRRRTRTLSDRRLGAVAPTTAEFPAHEILPRIAVIKLSTLIEVLGCVGVGRPAWKLTLTWRLGWRRRRRSLARTRSTQVKDIARRTTNATDSCHAHHHVPCRRTDACRPRRTRRATTVPQAVAESLTPGYRTKLTEVRTRRT